MRRPRRSFGSVSVGLGWDHRHDPERAGVDDENVFAQERKRQGRMHRVAERVEDGRHVAWSVS